MMFDLLQLDGPFVLNFGLRNVSKYRMVTVDGYGFEEEHRTHMDEIVASPVWIEDIRDVDENSVEIFKGPLDLLWQAFGQAGCPIRMLEEELA